MKYITVISGQSLADIANQELGAIDAIFDLALINGISITASLEPGTQLKIPSSKFKDTDIATQMFGKMIASDIRNTDQELILPDGGIGAMIIEDTLIVY